MQGMDSSRKRLDQLLTETGHARSRSQARDMILRKCVSVDGKVITKPSQSVDAKAALEISDPAKNYVSRAALKLIAGLDAAGISVTGRVAVDLGASTGGFTQVLLERGAQHVYGVEVGSGQMAQSLSDDPAVTLLENTNARDLTLADLGGQEPDIVVSDLSFISLRLAAEPSLLMARRDDAHAVLLVKPQFEVGRDGIGKGGIVSDAALVEATNRDIISWFNNLPGWQVSDFLPSPIKGGDGNSEFLLCGRRS